MNYDNWKSKEPDLNEETEEQSASSEATCYCDECGNEPGITLGAEWREEEINVCQSCLSRIESGPDEPDYDAPTAREEQIRMYEQKYYGKGL